MQAAEQRKSAGLIFPHKLAECVHGPVQILRYTCRVFLENLISRDIPRQVLGGTDFRNTGWRCVKVALPRIVGTSILHK